MKILTLVGTRPELIRLSVIIDKLDKLDIKHILVYTNQNYDYYLSKIFFEQMKIRKPDYYFNNNFNSFGEFLSNAIIEFEKILINDKPDKILILGDTNSGLLSIIAEKYNITIYHMEAGNRCYDNRLPEETNRKIIDSVSKYNLPYTEISKENLLSEGYNKNFVFKIGNPIFEVLTKYKNEIKKSNILNLLNTNEFILLTIHRCENVDNENILRNIINAINIISNKITILFPLHPRTKDKLNLFDIKLNKNIIILDPLGFYDFVTLEKNAKCVISDSGTVQEECCILGTPSLTIRESTERKETIESGSNIICGTNKNNILNSYNLITKKKWNIPSDYLVPNVSDIVINILIGM